MDGKGIATALGTALVALAGAVAVETADSTLRAIAVGGIVLGFGGIVLSHPRLHRPLVLWGRLLRRRRQRLPGWITVREQTGDAVALTVRHRFHRAGRTVRGFWCEVDGPAGRFVINDRERGRQNVFVPLAEWDLPDPTTAMQNVYPDDFDDAPRDVPLADGLYLVTWRSWDWTDEGLISTRTIPVQVDLFRVRGGRVRG